MCLYFVKILQLLPILSCYLGWIAGPPRLYHDSITTLLRLSSELLPLNERNFRFRCQQLFLFLTALHCRVGN